MFNAAENKKYVLKLCLIATLVPHMTWFKKEKEKKKAG